MQFCLILLRTVQPPDQQSPERLELSVPYYRQDRYQAQKTENLSREMQEMTASHELPQATGVLTNTTRSSRSFADTFTASEIYSTSSTEIYTKIHFCAQAILTGRGSK